MPRTFSIVFCFNSSARAKIEATVLPHHFHGQSVEIQSLSAENLARRLGVNELSLSTERENKSPSEFESWSRHRDPGSRGWRFGEDGLYYPVK
ncbi:hypothetical protein [Fischerella thermalis]|uniref:hypothetical protein n=1 Tax=Fischerella thermalis TaxID=372787 RepID=UPI00358DC27F